MKFSHLYILPALLLLSGAADARTQVVASTADLAYYARQIGGQHVEAEAIASPKADVHFVEVRPSYMMKVSRADVVLKIGMELDTWMDGIIDGSRNGSVRIVDCSKYIEPLEVPAADADARHGDLHRQGNPHYWLGPQNLLAITRAITEGLSAADPAHATDFSANQQRFIEQVEAGLAALKWKTELLRGTSVVFYHNSWPYFNAYVGLDAAGFVEPFPGVPPSPSHIKSLTVLVRERSIPLIAIEPYFDDRVPRKITSETGGRIVTLYPSIGGGRSDETYLEWFEGNLDALAGAAE